MNWFIFSGLILILASFCCAQNNCPDANEIKPCTCDGSSRPFLYCENVIDPEVLKRVFRNSAGRYFLRVYLKNSVLNYIPTEVFSDVKIQELYIQNLTLSQIFDESPKQLKGLKLLELSETKVLRGIIWEILEPMVELTELYILREDVKVLKQDFSQYASASLTDVRFFGTKLTSIKPGVFEKFTNLKRFYLQNGKLEELRRDIFPSPFNSIETLAFELQKLQSLPDGMFSGMPNLKTLALTANNISEISSSAFDGNVNRLNQLNLGGNPIRCDCKLKWLLESRPKKLDGNCETPERLKGRSLSDLKTSDLNCN